MNNFLSFQIHGAAGGHAHDGVAGGVEQFLTFLESLLGLSSAELFATLMPGIAAMANIHPVVVHFPIAFLASFFVVEVLGSMLKNDAWRQLASGLLYLGTLAAAAAVGAGLMAEGAVEHGQNVHEIMENHETLGFTVLGLSVFLSVWRLLTGHFMIGFGYVVFLFLALVLNIVLLFGADLGGLMVYKYGVGVKAVEVTMQDYFHEHTHSH